jgi:hypothetical protein
MRMKIIGMAALLAGAAITPGLAQDTATADAGKDKKVERVVIIERGEHDGDGPVRVMRMRHEDGKPGETRHVEIHRKGDKGEGAHVIRMHGPDGAHMAMADCDGEKTEINEGDDKRKTKILFCGDKSLTAAQRADKLEEIRRKMAERQAIGAEHRAKVEAALQQEIDRLRASK